MKDENSGLSQGAKRLINWPSEEEIMAEADKYGSLGNTFYSAVQWILSTRLEPEVSQPKHKTISEAAKDVIKHRDADLNFDNKGLSEQLAQKYGESDEHVKVLKSTLDAKYKDVIRLTAELAALHKELEQCRIDLKEERNEVESRGKTISAQRKSNLTALLKDADAKNDALQQQNTALRGALEVIRVMALLKPSDQRSQDIWERANAVLSSGEKKPET